jgi:hypothetical protein
MKKSIKIITSLENISPLLFFEEKENLISSIFYHSRNPFRVVSSADGRRLLPVLKVP